MATASTKDTAPVIIGQRLRKGAANSARGAKRFVTDALATPSLAADTRLAPSMIARLIQGAQARVIEGQSWR